MINDLHADLFYADKFKDMVILKKKALRKDQTLITIDDELTESILQSNESQALKNMRRENLYLRTDVIDPDMHVPLEVPNEYNSPDGTYRLTFRRYHYTDAACKAHAAELKGLYKYKKPAKPLVMQVENYDPYVPIGGLLDK